MGQTHSDNTGTAGGGLRRFWLAAFVVISSCCWAAQAHAQHHGPPVAPPPAPVVRVPIAPPPIPQLIMPPQPQANEGVTPQPESEQQGDQRIMKSRAAVQESIVQRADPSELSVYSWEQWNADGEVAKAKLDADLAEAQKNYLAKQESAHDTRKAEIKAARALKGQARQSAEKKAARKWSIKYDENLKEIREIRAKLWKLFSADSAKRKGRYIAARDGTPPTSSTPAVAATPTSSTPTSSTPASTTPTSSVTVDAPPPIPDLANLPLPPMEPVGTGSIDPGMGPSVGPLGTGPGGLLVGERYLPTIIINDPDVRPLTNWPLIFGKVGAVGVGIEKVGSTVQRHFQRLAWRNYFGAGQGFILGPSSSISVAYYGFRVAAPSVLLAAEVGGVVMTGGTILFGGAVVGAVGYGGYKLYKAYKEESRKLGPNARWQGVWRKLIYDQMQPTEGFEIFPATSTTGIRQ